MIGGRKSSTLFVFLVAGILLVCLMFVHAYSRQQMDTPSLHESSEIARVLGLGDLCLFTEARYTRHPNMADLHTPFQDHPMSLEHFPSGSIMPVPAHLWQSADR